MRRRSLDKQPGATASTRWTGLVAIAAVASVAFLGSLLATFPARIAAGYAALPEDINGFHGTVWNGGATVPGGHSLRWRLNGRRSLATLRPVFAVGLTGQGSELEAEAALRGLLARDLRVRGLSGRLAWPLVAALAPALDVACDLVVEVDAVDVGLGGEARSAQGGLSAGPGACTEGAGDAVPVPALLGTIETRETGIGGVLARAAQPGVPLADVELSNGDRLLLTVFEEGAALVPGLPSGEIRLEYPLDPLPF